MPNKIKIFAFYAINASLYTFGVFHNFFCCIFPEYNNNVYESTKHKLQYLTTWDSVCYNN